MRSPEFCYTGRRRSSSSSSFEAKKHDWVPSACHTVLGPRVITALKLTGLSSAPFTVVIPFGAQPVQILSLGAARRVIRKAKIGLKKIIFRGEIKNIARHYTRRSTFELMTVKYIINQASPSYRSTAFVDWLLLFPSVMFSSSIEGSGAASLLAFQRIVNAALEAAVNYSISVQLSIPFRDWLRRPYKGAITAAPPFCSLSGAEHCFCQ